MEEEEEEEGSARVTDAVAVTSQQLSQLATPLDHHTQGPKLPFGYSLILTIELKFRVQ